MPECLVAVSLLVVSPVAADSVYHSTHIPLAPVGDAPLQSGFVENIHANGPTVYAQERYVLNGAVPDSDYQVTIHLYFMDPTCSTTPIDIDTAMLHTNPNGNAVGKATFTPEDAAGLRGATHGAVWTLSRNGTVEYQTTCRSLALD